RRSEWGRKEHARSTHHCERQCTGRSRRLYTAGDRTGSGRTDSQGCASAASSAPWSGDDGHQLSRLTSSTFARKYGTQPRRIEKDATGSRNGANAEPDRDG